MANRSLFTRHFGFFCGREPLQKRGYTLAFFLGDRSRYCEPGESRYRLKAGICLFFSNLQKRWRFGSFFWTAPAWQDEPSVMAEYRRTMRK